MEYVLLDMKWNMIISNKQLEFDVRQLAAIHVDEKLHTISTFHRLSAKDCRMAKQIAYTTDVDENAIMDIENAWEEFREWLPDDVIFLVWDSEMRQITIR
ncbi:MAG: hypothetical protein E7290_08115 [Lachnospiraceae bacterium]|nr:hypothetical protein [Lachnospiraceae bacterium]